MSSKTPKPSGTGRRRVIVVSGGTDGMGRSFALARAGFGDTVIVLGSNAEKGERLLRDAARLNAENKASAAGKTEFVQVDLASIEGTRSAIRRITARHEVIDALALFANRQNPSRTLTVDGLERTFSVYYLSRYLLSHELSPLLRRSASPVIVNVAGVGMKAGRVHWEDLQLERSYSTVTAQLQAGRANDLLGVAFAALPDNPIRYVLYHPGFTRSGDLAPFPPPIRVLFRTLALLAARPVKSSTAPVHGFVDTPPDVPLTAIDRGRPLPLSLATLDPANAARLAEATRSLLQAVAPGENAAKDIGEN